MIGDRLPQLRPVFGCEHALIFRMRAAMLTRVGHDCLQVNECVQFSTKETVVVGKASFKSRTASGVRPAPDR
jgi:hypothetical protein